MLSGRGTSRGAVAAAPAAATVGSVSTLSLLRWLALSDCGSVRMLIRVPVEMTLEALLRSDSVVTSCSASGWLGATASVFSVMIDLILAQ